MSSSSTICLVLVFSLTAQPALAAVRGDKAMYMGGTITTIKEKTKGRFDVSGETAAVFLSEKGQSLLEIPYNNITSLEYGQRAGRRVGAAIAVSPVFLFSKKRRHYLTVSFADAASASQAAVFELSKGTVQRIVNALETRSGKKVEFESDEAKKHFEKETKP